jgi:hypothetical protein
MEIFCCNKIILAILTFLLTEIIFNYFYTLNTHLLSYKHDLLYYNRPVHFIKDAL